VDRARNDLLTAEGYWGKDVIEADVFDLPRLTWQSVLSDLYPGVGNVTTEADASDAVGAVLNAALGRAITGLGHNSLRLRDRSR